MDASTLLADPTAIRLKKIVPDNSSLTLVAQTTQPQAGVCPRLSAAAVLDYTTDPTQPKLTTLVAPPVARFKVTATVTLSLGSTSVTQALPPVTVVVPQVPVPTTRSRPGSSPS